MKLYQPVKYLQISNLVICLFIILLTINTLKRMKKFFILLMTMAGLSTTINAQVTIDETNFPDPKFRSYLRAQDYGRDGIITAEEIEGIEVINTISYRNISDLTGISFFTSLKNLLCFDNALTSLDLSNCPNLEELSCYNNQLVSLNLSNCPKLWMLDCVDNQLTSLDLSKCPELDRVYCLNNQLNDQAMFDMVISLPDRSETNAGVLRAVDLTHGYEKNVCTTTTVGVARALNWYVHALISN